MKYNFFKKKSEISCTLLLASMCPPADNPNIHPSVTVTIGGSMNNNYLCLFVHVYPEVKHSTTGLRDKTVPRFLRDVPTL